MLEVNLLEALSGGCEGDGKNGLAIWLMLHLYNCLKLYEVNEVFGCRPDVPEFQIAATSAIGTHYEGFEVLKQHLSGRLPTPFSVPWEEIIIFCVLHWSDQPGISHPVLAL